MGYLQMKRITAKFWKKDKIITSESETKWNRTHKPGGTVTIIREPLNNAIVESGSDPHMLGRWSYCTIRGKLNTKVIILTAYRTCKCDIEKTGINTFAAQQWNQLE